jgi:hypothetical protein
MEYFMKTFYTTLRAGIQGRGMRFLGAMLILVLTTPAVVFSISQPPPTLQSPSVGAVNVSTTPVLSWSAAAGDSVYYMQIDTNTAFGTILHNDTLTVALDTITGLRNATTYYWRVKVRKTLASGGWMSAFSAIDSFTTQSHTSVIPAQLPVTLGMTGGFAILSYAGVTDAGASAITGNVGTSPDAGSYITISPSTVIGTIYTVDASGPAGSVTAPAMLTQAMGDLTTAYNDAAGRTVNPIGVAGNLGGQTLYPGLYKSNGSLEISSGNLTLDAQGDINAVWIFQIASNFNMTSGRQVFLSGGAKASNIFWQVGSGATFGTTAVMKGTIMAYANITFATGASLEGRALARTESVTLQGNVIGGTAESPLSTAIFLGTAANFKVLAGSKVSNTGATNIAGDVGVYPNTVINGFPPGIFTGVQYPGDATSAAAQLDLKAAYDSAAARTSDSTIAVELGGHTYTQGVYRSGTGSLVLTTDTLTLNGGGDANAVWIFKMTDSLTTASNSYVKLTNGAQWYNVFWQVGMSATLGTNSTFKGNLMAFHAITANAGTKISGRLLAQSDSVSLSSDTIGGAVIVTSVARTESVPKGFTLLQNYPNPFNPSTKIQYTIGNAALITLKVYDILGREVAELVNGRQEAGSYTVSFNTKGLSSGVYFYRLNAGSFVSTKKLILMK